MAATYQQGHPISVLAVRPSVKTPPPFIVPKEVILAPNIPSVPKNALVQIPQLTSQLRSSGKPIISFPKSYDSVSSIPFPPILTSPSRNVPAPSTVQEANIALEGQLIPIVPLPFLNLPNLSQSQSALPKQNVPVMSTTYPLLTPLSLFPTERPRVVFPKVIKYVPEIVSPQSQQPSSLALQGQYTVRYPIIPRSQER